MTRYCQDRCAARVCPPSLTAENPPRWNTSPGISICKFPSLWKQQTPVKQASAIRSTRISYCGIRYPFYIQSDSCHSALQANDSTSRSEIDGPESHTHRHGFRINQIEASGHHHLHILYLFRGRDSRLAYPSRPSASDVTNVENSGFLYRLAGSSCRRFPLRMLSHSASFPC